VQKGPSSAVTIFLPLRTEILPQNRVSVALPLLCKLNTSTSVTRCTSFQDTFKPISPEKNSCPTAAKMAASPRSEKLYMLVHHVESTKKDAINFSPHVQHVSDINGLANTGSELLPQCQKNMRSCNRDCLFWKMK
jgi:hypothetical protein